jgi:uncharacterized protein
VKSGGHRSCNPCVARTEPVSRSASLMPVMKNKCFRFLLSVGIGWLSPTFLLIVFCCSFRIPAAEILPPKPKHYFNDYASIISKATAEKLNKDLEDFERSNSSQIVIVIYPKLDSSSNVADFTLQTAKAWGFGQKGRNNGVVLFVFVQEHKIQIQVGLGLQKALNDALCLKLIQTEIAPKFKAKDFDGGLKAGAGAIIRAIKGESQGVAE